MNNSFSPRTPRERTGEKRGSPRAESGAQQEAPGPGTRWIRPLPVSVTRDWHFQQRVCPLEERRREETFSGFNLPGGSDLLSQVWGGASETGLGERGH